MSSVDEIGPSTEFSEGSLEETRVSSDDDYWMMVDRNTGVFTRREQERIRNTVVAQAGVGGNSDIIFTLAQMGFRKFRIADPDVFELSNFNRQLGANIQTLGMNKALAVAQAVQRIDGNAEVEVYPDGVTMDNVEDFVTGSDIIVDGIDIAVMEERKALYDAAREQGLPVFSSPAPGFGAALAIFDPIKSPTFTEFFGPIPKTRDTSEWHDFVMNFGLQFIGQRIAGLDIEIAQKRRKEGKSPAIAPGCRTNSALVSTAIIGWMFNRGDIPIAPTTIHVDLMGGKIVRTGPKKRWLMKKIMARSLSATPSSRVLK